VVSSKKDCGCRSGKVKEIPFSVRLASVKQGPRSWLIRDCGRSKVNVNMGRLSQSHLKAVGCRNSGCSREGAKGPD